MKGRYATIASRMWVLSGERTELAEMILAVRFTMYSLRGPLCAGEAFFFHIFPALALRYLLGGCAAFLWCWPTAKRRVRVYELAYIHRYFRTGHMSRCH